MKRRWIERISILVLFILAYNISVYFDLMEFLTELLDITEHIELDELIPTGAIMCIGFAIISALRMKRLKKQEKEKKAEPKPAKLDYEIIENLISLQLDEVSTNSEKIMLTKLSHRLSALKIYQKLSSQSYCVSIDEYMNSLVYSLIENGNPGISFSVDLPEACPGSKLLTTSGIIISDIVYSIKNNTNNSPNKVLLSVSSGESEIIIQTDIPFDRNRNEMFDTSLLETFSLALHGKIKKTSSDDVHRILIKLPFNTLVDGCTD